MSHLPFLKALTTEGIPMNRTKTNPQCILGFSTTKNKNTRVQKKNKTPNLNSSDCFFFSFSFPGVNLFPPFGFLNKAEVSFFSFFFFKKRSDLRAGSGRWHPVIQLRFPLACAGCALLSSADRSMSSPKDAERRKKIKKKLPLFSSLLSKKEKKKECYSFKR